MIWIYLFLCLSALAAGIVNSIAGGGTLLTFPALLFTLRQNPDASVIANATSTVALVLGSVAGAWGYRHDLGNCRGWLWLLIPPCVVGGIVGAVLLTALPSSYFDALVPWLLLTASFLFLMQPTLNRWIGTTHGSGMPSRAMCVLFVFYQFLVAVYGGYFGAGIGILMLTSLGLMGLGNIHQMNAIKTVLAAIINGVSIVIFVAQGKVDWGYAGAMAITAVLGGYFGARMGRRLPKPIVRWGVILIGFSLAFYYFLKQAGVGSTG